MIQLSISFLISTSSITKRCFLGLKLSPSTTSPSLPPSKIGFLQPKIGSFHENGSPKKFLDRNDGILMSRKERMVVVRASQRFGGFSGGGRGNGWDRSSATRVLGNLALVVGLASLSMTGQLGWVLDAIVSLWVLMWMISINSGWSCFPPCSRMDVASCHLDGNADAVEFCPHDPFHHILAVATYTLQEGIQPNRLGSISLYSVDVDKGLQLLQHRQAAGIFDIKWNPDGSHVQPLLAQADADGCLSLYHLESNMDTDCQGSMLRELCTEKISSSMCLCVDWNPLAGSISLGLSDGFVSVVTVREAHLEVSQTWAAHDYELWTTAFDAYHPQLLYTGSDDCRFCCWDLRESPTKMVFQNAKTHKMGVCCIAQNPMSTNMLLTGSYDEFLRIWDVRSTTKPVNETSLCLGGGVWRIKHHPYILGLVLAACMHNGFAILRIREENANIVGTYNKHESLAYGADWQRGGTCAEDGTEQRTVVATCSFYDRLLRIWQPETLRTK